MISCSSSWRACSYVKLINAKSWFLQDLHGLLHINEMFTQLRLCEDQHRRKRHILVDTMGLLLMVMVLPADVQDRDGARQLLKRVSEFYKTLQLIWADGGYAGKLLSWVHRQMGCLLEIVKRSDNVRGFKVLPRRWVVERTFGWFGRYRRLSRDYERLAITGEAMVYLAMTRLMLRRLTK